MTQKTHDITSALNEFRSRLDAPDRDIAALTRARAETRQFLRGTFVPALRTFAEQSNLGQIPPDVRVRFLTQGSFAYRTLNHPAHIPPQQMDLDDGIYFRAFDVRMFSPGMLLTTMEGILGKWAQRNGWTIVHKPNCCRAVLPAANRGAEDKHIDWPLYAIRDDEMEGLEKRAQHKSRYMSAYEDWGISYHPWADEVLLAHREKGWVPSDPRKVIDWVADMKSKHGAKFINVCRYLKAWRDHQWTNSSLTSIAIMGIVAHAFEMEAQSDDKEDDLLLCAAKHIAPCLGNGVSASFDPSERLDGNISHEERRAISGKAENLRDDLESVLCGNLSKKEISVLLRKQFGDRFPDDEKMTHLCKLVAASSTAGAVAPPVRAHAPYAGDDD